MEKKKPIENEKKDIQKNMIKFKNILKHIFDETINKEDGKYVVRAKKSGKKLGTHPTKKKALKQLAAIEINKQK